MLVRTAEMKSISVLILLVAACVAVMLCGVAAPVRADEMMADADVDVAAVDEAVAVAGESVVEADESEDESESESDEIDAADDMSESPAFVEMDESEGETEAEAESESEGEADTEGDESEEFEIAELEADAETETQSEAAPNADCLKKYDAAKVATAAMEFRAAYANAKVCRSSLVTGSLHSLPF